MSPLYASEKDVAALLGMGIDWLRKNRDTLEKAHGFPKIDLAVGKRHIPSIETWAAQRNNRQVATIGHENLNAENLDEL